MPRSRSHALLIGIDRYRCEGVQDRGLYSNLEGAVLDVERWHARLQSRAIPEENILRLTAPLQDGVGPTLPTYQRVADALAELERRARPGDEVLFAFSGHGGCVPTLVPGLKGDDGVDEALILAEHSRPGAQVLRDVELAVVLRRWTDRDLRVTLCFDCCHAGGTTRRNGARLGIRGTGRLDTAPQPGVSRIARIAEICNVWRDAIRQRRTLHPASGWLPDPRGYVLFAASQAHERAYEGRFDRLGPGGAMTHALLQALDDADPDTTCAQLHRSLLAKVRQWTEGQTPQIEGEQHRTFWSSKAQRTADSPAVDVRLIELLRQGDPGHYLNGKLRLNAYAPPPCFDPKDRSVAALRRYISDQAPIKMPIRDREWICLKLKNDSLQPLYVALYAPLPDGGHKRIYPTAGIGEAELLRPNGWDLLPLRPRLPQGIEASIEPLAAIAANDPRLFWGETSPSIFWTVAPIDLSVIAS